MTRKNIPATLEWAKRSDGLYILREPAGGWPRALRWPALLHYWLHLMLHGWVLVGWLEVVRRSRTVAGTWVIGEGSSTGCVSSWDGLRLALWQSSQRANLDEVG